jgi:CubicO group peptidase (beta-lactamase class C family)
MLPRPYPSVLPGVALLLSGCLLGQALPPAIGAVDLPAFSPGRADPDRKAQLLALAPRLDEHFAKRFADAGATGLVVGIIIEGELVYAQGFGVRDVQSQAPVDVDTVFRIASLTKSFTATAVLRLRDEGKVTLDAPAASYVPELKTLSGPTRDSGPVTVRHLLTNASGLPYDDEWGVVSFGTSAEDLTRMLATGITWERAPGARYAYSNLGYALLGRIVERASGVRFRDYVTAQILRPLGMASTVWQAREVPLSRLAIGYRRSGEQLVPEIPVASPAFDAAGGLYTSLRDYARYVAFHLAAHPPRDDRETGPLRRSSLREMHEGQRWSRWRGDEAPVGRRTETGEIALDVASYGYGWLNLTTCADEGIVQHYGGEPGHWSTVHLLPKHQFGMVTFSTSAAVGSRAWAGVVGLLRTGGALPAPPEASPVPELAAVPASIGRLLQRWDQAVVAQTFDAPSLRFPWMAKLPADFARLSRDHGACHQLGKAQVRSRMSVAWRVQCERGAIHFTAGLTPTVPPRVQFVHWTEEPPGQAARDPQAICAQ